MLQVGSTVNMDEYCNVLHHSRLAAAGRRAVFDDSNSRISTVGQYGLLLAYNWNATGEA